MYHNESTSLEQSVIKYCGAVVASLVVKTYICSVRVQICKKKKKKMIVTPNTVLHFSKENVHIRDKIRNCFLKYPEIIDFLSYLRYFLGTQKRV